jgi:hypothetical protein
METSEKWENIRQSKTNYKKINKREGRGKKGSSIGNKYELWGVEKG